MTRHRHRVLALAGAGVLLAACGSSAQVVVTTAAARTVVAHPGGTGTFAAAVDVPVSLGYRAVISGVDVSLGQTVLPGQPLFSISSEELSRAVDELAVRQQADQATVATLQAALDALPSDSSAASAQRQKVQAAQARVALDARLLAAAQSRRDVVRAPAGGVVSTITAQPGMTITGSTSLLHIVDASNVSLDAAVPVAYRGQVAAGASVELTAVGAPAVHLTGTVTGVSPLASADGQTFVINVRAANPGGAAETHCYADQ